MAGFLPAARVRAVDAHDDLLEVGYAPEFARNELERLGADLADVAR